MSFVPPAVLDHWSYSGDFYVAASGNNHHRRATIPEIKATFDGTDGLGDRPGHWYEAQLLHYGLPPSKTKGTAKMRLHDALKAGQLSVPATILKIEADLKKEWAKRQREAKKAASMPSTPTPVTAPTPSSRKRKADDNATGSVAKSATAKQPAAKKAKPTVASTATSAPAKKAKATPKPATAASAQAVPATQRKQTARRGTSSTPARKSASASRVTAAPEPPKPARTKQTARRSRPFNPAAVESRRPAAPPLPQLEATPAQWDDFHEPPPPYSEFPDEGYGGYNSVPHINNNSHFPPLGLLNGRYKIQYQPTSPVTDVDQSRSHLVFTLDGNSLWGYFEIGPLQGVMYIPERPWESSRRELSFEWRGVDDQGVDHGAGLGEDGSWVAFLGDGLVEGEIVFFGDVLQFDARRLAGQGTRSEISVAEMRRRWDQM
jgi:hypothetical protein